MRVTNQMMNNSALYNLQRQQGRLAELEQQYSTEKKISKPSDDPIIAVRALKLRTNYSELRQYVEKNIPDADSWLELTESAVDNAISMLKTASEQCTYGATDTLKVDDRNSIATTLKELRAQLYQEGTTTYAGRYIFSGYKTDTNLLFDEATDNTHYSITEDFDVSDMDKKSYVTNATSATAAGITAVPATVDCSRIRLAYNECDSGATPTVMINGAAVAVTAYNTPADAAYQPTAGGISYIASTGELILGETVAAGIQNGDKLSATYEKSSFKTSDLRPEHYFTCEKTDGITGKVTNYTSENQEIKYMVNYNQTLTVNVQGKDCFTHDVGRDFDEILASIDDVTAAEDKVSQIEKRFNKLKESDTDYASTKELLEAAKVELDLKEKIMQTKFEAGQTAFAGHTDTFSEQLTSIGARQTRLTLIENRMKDQETNVEELMSNNEDVDMADIIVRYTAANDVYTAALSAASKCIKQTLLDFI